MRIQLKEIKKSFIELIIKNDHFKSDIQCRKRIFSQNHYNSHCGNCGNCTLPQIVQSLKYFQISILFFELQSLVMYPPPSIYTCTARVWLREIGFSLTYGALMLKTWR